MNIMKYIELYEDVNCTQLYGAFPTHPITYGYLSGSTVNVTISDKTYSIFGYVNNPALINNASVITANPPFLSVRNRYPNGKTFYLKNGLHFTVTEKTTGYNKISDSYIGTQRITREAAMYTTTDSVGSAFFIETIINNNVYYGLTFFYINQTNTTITPMLLSTADFWEGTFRPPYDYGTKPDEGGQATGNIEHSSVGRSTVAPNTFPTGAQGFHAYIITPTGLDELQGSLWGEGSTLAKSLWQKFLNSKHNPIHCVVGCYRLPTRFMPLRLQSSGVHLGGVNIPISSGNCYTTQLRIYTLPSISTDIVNPPFDSWLDYYGVSIKISIPFCGTITAPAEKVFGKTVSISYRVDQANGNLAALVYTGNYDYILGELTGNVSYNIPVCGGDDGTLTRLGAIASNALSIADSFVTGAQKAFSGGASEKAGFALSTVGKLRNVSDIIVPPFTTQIANCNMTGSIAACTNGIFYVEYLYANVAYAGYKEGSSQSSYAQAVGYPSYAGGTVGSFRGGYGEFYVIPNGWDVSGATAQEKNEIINLLETGVYV